MHGTFARARTLSMRPVGQARATIGYNLYIRSDLGFNKPCMQDTFARARTRLGQARARR